MKSDDKSLLYNKRLSIMIDKDMWRAIRKISFENEVSMCELLRRAIEKIISENGKKCLTNKL